MEYRELTEKYQASLTEINKLKEENKRLKAQLGIVEAQVIAGEIFEPKSEPVLFAQDYPGDVMLSDINNSSDPSEKIKLFMSIFKGRNDVFAKRWKNKKKGTYEYSPCCVNDWKYGLCRKPKGRCTGCPNKAYAGLDEKVIDDHLRGRGNLVAGIYPLRLDDTCFFLAIDFDDE